MQLEEYKARIEHYLPGLVVAKKVSLVGGFETLTHKRINVRFSDVESTSKSWLGFNIMLNDQAGELNIELHEAQNKRVYPLSIFVKTGNNKVCAYSILSPFTEKGVATVKQLPDKDISLLTSLLNELQLHIKLRWIEVSATAKDIDLSEWTHKIGKLSVGLSELREMSTNNTALTEYRITNAKPNREFKFDELLLLQNMIAETNEHLLVRFKNLAVNGQFFEEYEFKIGAKQVTPEQFTSFGSIEFRALAGNKPPLLTWPPQDQDKWGLKLVIDIAPELSKAQQQAIVNLKEQDKRLIQELLNGLANNIHRLKLNNVKVKQPIANWQKLLSEMAKQVSKWLS